MKEHRLAFFGTPDFSADFLEQINSHFEIKVVVTIPPIKKSNSIIKSPVQIRAENLGIRVLTPEKLNEEFLNEFEKEKIDLAVVISYGKIIGKKILDASGFGFLNVHYSLLPKLRGANPHRFLIFQKEIPGITFFKLAPGMDTGEIFEQKLLQVKEDWFLTITADELLMRLNELARTAIIEVINKYLNDCDKGSLQLIIQDENSATYANIQSDKTKTTLLKKEDGRIDLSWSSEKIKLHLNAFTGWPGSFTFIKNGNSIFRLIIEEIDIMDEYKASLSINGDQLLFKEEFKDKLKALFAGQIKNENQILLPAFRTIDNKTILVKKAKLINLQ